MRNHRLISIFIAAIMMLGLLGFAAPGGGIEAVKAQPELVALAVEDPGQMVEVIVQKVAGERDAEARVADLGGQVIADLSIINAFTAEMTAGAALELTRAEGVRWVSLDAPMVSLAAGDPTVRDEFAAASYSNNNGTQTWSSNWIEVDGAGTGPTAGNARITYGKLSLDDYPDTGGQPSLARGANLSGAISATLSFSFETTGGVDASDSAVVEVSADGGATYTILENFTGISGMSVGNRSYDITAFATNNTRVRFRIKELYGGSYEAFRVDNVQIEYALRAPTPTDSPTPTPTLTDPPAPMPSSNNEQVYVTWATSIGTAEDNQYIDAANMVDTLGLGPDGVYGYKTGNAKGTFAGFDAEVKPGYAITKVEAVLYAYVNESFSKDYKVKTYIDGHKMGEVKVKTDIFHGAIGRANAGLVYIDITGTKNWQWIDFYNNLELYIEHAGFAGGNTVYYDAIGLRVTSAPGTDTSLDGLPDTNEPDEVIDPSQQVNVYNHVIGASQLWNTNDKLQGKNIGIAVVDSGIAKVKDLKIKGKYNFNDSYHDSSDRYGHGTFVAGIIAGNGKSSKGRYIGVAPKATLYNVRVSDDNGMTYTSDVIEALQWIYENKDKTKIRVVNLSLNQSVPESYHTSPLDAAVEILWFNGIVVVVSAGNNGTATLYPPANDPFVITVGATDDKGTVTLDDDQVTTFSAFGTTEDGFAKPDLVAPGRNVIGLLPNNDELSMGKAHSRNRIDTTYFKMSGTSVSAPMVSGAIALLLQDEPELNPDQVKARLMATANKNWPGYDPTTAGAGYLDINAAVYANTTDSANQGIIPSYMLASGEEAIAFDSVGWNSVGWNSVGWNSVGWNSVGWNSVGWNSVGWNSVGWNSVGWNSDHWDE